MAKTKEELNQLKVEYEALTTKLQELTEEELMLVTGGVDYNIDKNEEIYNYHIYSDKDPLPFEPKFNK